MTKYGEELFMSKIKDLPLLLLDNSSMMSVLNKGEFRVHNLTLIEATEILDAHADEDILRCFESQEIERVIFDYLGATKRKFEYKRIRNMRPGQDALVFKLYVTPSETQPIIRADDDVEAKKIQNVYVYCQYLKRLA